LRSEVNELKELKKNMEELKKDVSFILKTWYDFRTGFEKDTDDRLAAWEINMEKQLNKKTKGKCY